MIAIRFFLILQNIKFFIKVMKRIEKGLLAILKNKTGKTKSWVENPMIAIHSSHSPSFIHQQ